MRRLRGTGPGAGECVVQVRSIVLYLLERKGEGGLPAGRLRGRLLELVRFRDELVEAVVAALDVFQKAPDLLSLHRQLHPSPELEPQSAFGGVHRSVCEDDGLKLAGRPLQPQRQNLLAIEATRR